LGPLDFFTVLYKGTKYEANIEGPLQWDGMTHSDHAMVSAVVVVNLRAEEVN